MFGLLIYILVLVIVVALALYVINNLIPDPMLNRVLTVTVVVIAAICIIYLLLGLAGGGMPRLLR